MKRLHGSQVNVIPVQIRKPGAVHKACFALFDDELDSAERRAMATQLASLPNQGDFAPGKPVFPVDLMLRNPKLASFVGPRRWMLFNILHANGTWFQK